MRPWWRYSLYVLAFVLLLVLGAALWLVRGFGHAESAISTDDLDRIGAWARECVVGAEG